MKQALSIILIWCMVCSIAFATVSTETNRIRYAGNGTSYAVTFVFYNTDEITVIRTSAAGNDTTLTETTNYSVSGGSGSTGTVTTVTSYSDGYITIIRNEPMTQETDWQVNGNFNVETLEDNLDRSTMQAQRIQEQVTRSLKVSTAEDVSSIDFTVPVTASKVIGWDSAGTGLTLYGTTAYSGDADTTDNYNTELGETAAGATRYLLAVNTSGLAQGYLTPNLAAAVNAVDGSGSGIDADLLDGVDGGALVANALTEQTNSLTMLIANIPIGDWDMDASADGSLTVSVAHGLTGTSIRKVFASIRNDAGDTYYDVPTFCESSGVATCLTFGTDLTTGGAPTINKAWDATNVYLVHDGNASFFDSTSFDSTSFNRGWITVWYAQ